MKLKLMMIAKQYWTNMSNYLNSWPKYRISYLRDESKSSHLIWQPRILGLLTLFCTKGKLHKKKKKRLIQLSFFGTCKDPLRISCSKNVNLTVFSFFSFSLWSISLSVYIISYLLTFSTKKELNFITAYMKRKKEKRNSLWNSHSEIEVVPNTA